MHVTFTVRFVKSMQGSLHIAMEEVIDELIHGNRFSASLRKLDAYPCV